MLLLTVWTVIAAVWWVIAISMVALGVRRESTSWPMDGRRLTIFKSLPSPIPPAESATIETCLESFVAELDASSELLIGCHRRDESVWRAFLDRMTDQYPDADIRLIVHDDPNHYPHAKVSWMKILAEFATGELWLWSDADMVAPRGTLDSLRRGIAEEGVKMVTSPYVVRAGDSGPEVLDTLFVNAEFYPGAVLMSRMGAVRFAFGSGMLFEAESFKQRIDWNFIGNALAEDYHMGQALQPVRLSSQVLETIPSSGSWRDSILHYLRWQKTIRWVRPGSFAAQLIIIPIIGWLMALILDPLNLAGWLGLAAVVAMEAVAVTVICRFIGTRIGLRRIYALPVWSFVRASAWLACWLPWPIVWRGKRWWKPHWNQPSPEAVGSRSQPEYK
jgi:ceramide glucosyltransferase